MTTSTGAPAELNATSDSDDESFVILGRSCTPESYIDVERADEEIRGLDTNVVEESLKLTETALSQLNSVNVEFKSMPSHYQQPENILRVIQETATSSPTSSVDLGPDVVLQKVNLLLEENRRLKGNLEDSLHQNNLIMKKQYEMLVTWQEEVMKVHSLQREKFGISKTFVENLKTRNIKLLEDLESSLATQNELKKEIECLKSKETNSNGSSGQVPMLLQQIEALEKELREEKMFHQKSIDVCRSKTREAETVQEILLEELKIMKANFNEQALLKSANEQMVAFENSNMQSMQTKVDALEKTISELKLNNEESLKYKSNELAKVQVELTNINKAKSLYIEELENDLKNAHTTMFQKNNKTERLQCQLEEVIVEKNKLFEAKQAAEDSMAMQITNLQGNVTHLEAQIETYKVDFDAEHRINVALTEDKNRLSRDLQAVQQHNQLLMEEIEHLRSDSAHSFVHVPPNPPPETATFSCPICNFKFTNYQALENHVHRCMEVNSVF